jgi:hypothetical protein
VGTILLWKSGSEEDDDWRERAWQTSPVVCSLDVDVRVRLDRGRFILEQDGVSHTEERSGSDEHRERG